MGNDCTIKTKLLHVFQCTSQISNNCNLSMTHGFNAYDIFKLNVNNKNDYYDLNRISFSYNRSKASLKSLWSEKE
jgi:hypothetical protein